MARAQKELGDKKSGFAEQIPADLVKARDEFRQYREAYAEAGKAATIAKVQVIALMKSNKLVKIPYGDESPRNIILKKTIKDDLTVEVGPSKDD